MVEDSICSYILIMVFNVINLRLKFKFASCVQLALRVKLHFGYAKMIFINMILT